MNPSASANGSVDEMGNRKADFIPSLTAIVVFIFFDLLDWIQGGGLLSIALAFKASQRRAAVIDVDSAGLRLAFIIACVIATGMLFWAMRWGGEERGRSALLMFVSIGAGFVLDAIYDERVMESYLSSHGYSRCPTRDHVVGSGKSHVWFDNYVLKTSDCAHGQAKSSAAAAIPADPRLELPRPAKPVESPADWFSEDDYPALALRDNIEGVAKVRVVIDPDGHIRHCDVIASSGSPLLDTSTCEIFTTKGRYWPARDPSGKAISQTDTRSVKWQIP